MSEPQVKELFVAIMKYGVATGATRIDLLPGCWERQVSDECWISMNGHKEPIKNSKGHILHPFQIYIEWNGWPAGIVEPGGGTVMGHWGDKNGEDLLIEHFEKATSALKDQPHAE